MILPLTLAALFTAPQDPLDYELRYRAPGSPRVEITLRFPGLAAPQTLVMPRAIPMGYSEQPYDQFVRDVRAFTADARPLQVFRGEGPRWEIPRGTVARIEYDVDLSRMEREILSASDTSKIRPGYVGILGYSVFAYIDGQEDRPIQLRITAPED